MHLARHAAQVDAVHREVSAAWEKSKADRTQRRHRRIDKGIGADDAAPTGVQTVAEAVATTREGDPRFSAQMLRAL